MIDYEAQYLDWLKEQGVGDRDRVASSPASYCSYLRSAAGLAGIRISPVTVYDLESADRVAEAAVERRAPGTVRNYRCALRQYAAMVQARRM